MRITALFLALALAACGPSTQSSDDAPNDDALPYGAIIGVGENWSFNANPADNAASVYVEDGTEASGSWTPPQTIATGQYRLVAGDIIADLAQAECQLNGLAYPMSATITIPDRTLTGCAAMRWDYQLIALMPQIDACIAATPGANWVSYAGPGPDGVLVRLVADGGGYDCSMANGATTTTSAPRNETLLMASEHTVTFYRALEGAQNPGGECYEAPEVRGANNELLGWLMEPMGC